MVFLYLQLPAEIRNSIYEYVAYKNGQPWVIRPINPRIKPQTFGGEWVEPLSEIFQCYRMSFAQICKQLRREYLSVFRACATVAVYCRHLIEFQEDFLVNPSSAVACPNKLNIYMRGESWNFLTDITLLLKKRIQSPSFSSTFLEDPHTPKRQRNDEWVVAKRDMYCDMPNEMFSWKDPVWVSLVRDGLLIKVVSFPSYSEVGHWRVKVGGRQSDVEEARRAEIEGLFKNNRPHVERHEWSDGTFIIFIKLYSLCTS